MWHLLTGLVGKVVTGYQNRKAKEADARAAWEQAMGRSMENGWKDEYVTVIITLPLLQIFVGNLLSIWFPEKGTAILAANTASLQQIGALMETQYGVVMIAVVLAAVGIKGLKALK